MLKMREMISNLSQTQEKYSPADDGPFAYKLRSENSSHALEKSPRRHLTESIE